jgi:ATP-dependent Clp endopeptidase proteolytic subunit ClpP
MSWIELVAQRRPPTAPPGMQPPENAKSWFRIENSAEDTDTTDIYVYDSIGGWFGMYADEFIEALGQVTSKNISLRLNSPGGSVFEGIAIANAIRNHPANVTVYVDSLAASIASVIALAGNRLVMMPQSQIMIHNASGACYGDATEMTRMADLLDKQSRNIAEAYAQHTGRPLAEWQQYMADETWFTAEEAVAVGLADEAMPMRPKKGEDAEEPANALASVMNRSWDLSMYNYAGRDSAPAPVIVNTVATTEAAEDVKPVEAEPVESPGVLSNMSRDDLTAMIREAVRAEVEDATKKLPPFLQPDEDEDEDEESDEDADDSASEDPEAKAEETPAAISAGDDIPSSEPPTAPADEAGGAAEIRDENDVWQSLVARLTDSPSPSADDVFKSLKEAW